MAHIGVHACKVVNTGDITGHSRSGEEASIGS